MKFFKKKRLKLPRPGSVERMIARRYGPLCRQRYNRELRIGRELPIAIRMATLARLHPQNRQFIVYYPDISNFITVREPNRSLPIRKFLDLFRNMIDHETLERVYHDLTNYRLEIYTTLEKWVEVYADENVHTCMSQCDIIRCYIHEQNHLAIAALYAPGGTKVIARSIVNTEEKWYVRLFGDSLLVDKLQALGYFKLNSNPTPFRMYAFSPSHYAREAIQLPYFDFPHSGITHFPETYNADTQLFEVEIS